MIGAPARMRAGPTCRDESATFSSPKLDELFHGRVRPGARVAEQIKDAGCEVCLRHTSARGRRDAKRHARHPGVRGRRATHLRLEKRGEAEVGGEVAHARVWRLAGVYGLEQALGVAHRAGERIVARLPLGVEEGPIARLDAEQ